MKSILLSFFITFLFTSKFENDNFIIEDNSILWQKVYESELNKEEIITRIKGSGDFKNITEDTEKIYAEINQLSLDYKGYGVSEMTAPIYISRSYIKAFVIFEFKDKRYRVTLKNIKFVQKYEDALSEEGEISDIELYALKKKKH